MSVYEKSTNKLGHAGFVKVASTFTNNKFGRSMLDSVFPIGTYVQTTSTTFNPNVSYGGTWNKTDGAGQILVGQSTSGTFATINASVGAETITLILSQIPSHTHGGTGAHTHTIATHSHTAPNHTHTIGSHGHGGATSHTHSTLNHGHGSGSYGHNHGTYEHSHYYTYFSNSWDWWRFGGGGWTNYYYQQYSAITVDASDPWIGGGSAGATSSAATSSFANTTVSLGTTSVGYSTSGGGTSGAGGPTVTGSGGVDSTSQGGGGSHTNNQPYKVCVTWHRTA